ncbi:hypothetical protein POJ06DRAFT_59995 [Lipomyces tetrasporus]|uniref:F-box domain-containing protein n=1 Tax=Lipomyces tetrasporus TaxID=54092 RepID=A0AAD7QWU0_9ASCO|nr:uncharacterized protein POJ06DRAFT_59995 [Lipomyces tetrasporus]KAJ8102964.1 hypothetical protein POJ06DRAFT_59995 [Lipomyces tetrasporus]
MRSDRRASPLYLSTRSNALHFYDPSPQRRHLHLASHYPHPSQQVHQQRASFYELFVPESSVEAELPTTESSSSSTSSKGRALATTPRDRPTVLSYSSLLDPDESEIPRSNAAANDSPTAAAATALLQLVDDEDEPSRFGASSDSSLSAEESDSDSDYGPRSERRAYPHMHPRLSGRSGSVLPPPLPILAETKLVSSGASIRSFRSRTSALSWNRSRKHHRPTLDTLPLEVLDEICSSLPQQALLSMVNTCKSLSCSAYVFLYQKPHFTSTYRFAQFVSVITHDRPLASYVRSLDLSTIENGLKGNVVLAGWRDWKYRSEPLYWTRKYSGQSYFHHQHRHRAGTVPLSKSAPQAPPAKSRLPGRRASLSIGSSSSSSSASSSSSSLVPSQQSLKPMAQHQSMPSPLGSTLPSVTTKHPLQSPLLKQYSLSRDVPIGAIIHVIRACPHLQHINLSYLPLAADYYVTSRKYKPTAFTNLLFVSDVPKSYTWREHETVQVRAGRELVSAIMELRELQTLELRNLVWITKDIIKRIVEHERFKQTLTYVDVRESGMSRGRPWALAGGLEVFNGVMDE